MVKNTLLTVALLFLSTPGAVAEPVALKVGVILGLSGDAAFVAVANEMKSGMEAAVKTAPPGSLPIRLIFEDDKGAIPQEAVRAAVKLISADKVDLILNWGYSAHPAIAPVCERNKTPCVVVWDANDEADRLGPYNFAVGVSTEGAGRELAAFGLRKLSKKRAAIIAVEDHWSSLLSTSFAEQWTGLGGQVVLKESVAYDTSDLRQLILRAKAAEADLLFLPLYGSLIQTAIKQADMLGFEGKILCGDSLIEADIETLGKLTEGVYAGQVWISDPAFKVLYEKELGRSASPSGLAFAAMGYDAVRFAQSVVARLTAAGQPITREHLRQGMLDTPFSGATGAFDLKAGKKKTESIAVIRNGRFERVY